MAEERDAKEETRRRKFEEEVSKKYGSNKIEEEDILDKLTPTDDL